MNNFVGMDNVRFSEGELPFVYSDPMSDTLGASQDIELLPVSGVRVFDFSIPDDLAALQSIMQQVAFGYCKFDIFNLQFFSGKFLAFVAWTMYQRVPSRTAADAKMRSWNTCRRYDG